MSDQSSESSGDSWVFVNENDDISLETDETQPLNLELNYDSICFAALDSMKSSLSSEELEWQYENLENDIDLVPCFSSHVEDLDLYHSQNGHLDCHNPDQTGDIELNSCCSSNHYEEDVDIDIVAVHKLHSYKHHRNDYLNFILNVMLALTVSSALGLGTGHFLGWSHKCWRNISYYKEVNNHIVPNAVLINQNTEDFLSTEKETSPTFSQDLQEAFDLTPKLEKSSMYDEICKKTSSNSVINSITNRIFQNYVSSNSDTLEPSISNVENQNKFTDSKYTSTPKIIHDWSGLSRITLPAKSLNEHISNFSDKTTLERDGDMNSRTKEMYLQSKFFNRYDNKKENSNKGTNFTSELRKDLIQVVQTLNTIALTHISSGKEMPVEELRLMTELYKDLEIIINAKISYIDEFLLTKDYKKYSKFGLRYMQKMIYSLIDTFDYVAKINMKTFGKNYKQVNFFKFSKNIYKIIFNFDKRWEKNLKNWSENMEKTKAQEHKRFYDYNKNTFKRVKHWKKRVPFQNDLNKTNKYKRHSVKY